MTTETTTTALKQAKVFQLCKELDEMKDKKKSISKSYNDEIKRIQTEIDELINSDGQPQDNDI